MQYKDNLMFKLMLFFCCFVTLSLHLPATCSKKDGPGTTKDWKSCGMLKNTCSKHSTGKHINCK